MGLVWFVGYFWYTQLHGGYIVSSQRKSAKTCTGCIILSWNHFVVGWVRQRSTVPPWIWDWKLSQASVITINCLTKTHWCWGTSKTTILIGTPVIRRYFDRYIYILLSIYITIYIYYYYIYRHQISGYHIFSKQPSLLQPSKLHSLAVGSFLATVIPTPTDHHLRVIPIRIPWNST